VLDRWSGLSVQPLKLHAGFHAGKEVSVQYYSTDVPDELASQTANDSGECTMQFTIRSVPPAAMKYLPKEIGDYAQTDIEIIPSLSINPAVAAVGIRWTFQEPVLPVTAR